MNFRFTKAKVIWSIIISIIADLIFWFFAAGMYGSRVFATWIDYIFSLPSLIFFLVFILMIYLIWSAIQKK